MKLNLKILLKSCILVLMLVAGIENSFAQKKLITNYEEIVAAAKTEFDSMMSPSGALIIEASKRNINGEYVIDMTIHERGKVLSVFVVSSNAADVKMQNAAKDLIRSVELNFKMPKGKTYKFQYTFNFK